MIYFFSVFHSQYAFTSLKAMAPKLPIEIIGIRPGEKIHEVMCPSDDSHLTIEFEDHFVICPSIIYFSRENEFTSNLIGEKGVLVEQGFEYNSDCS